MTTDHTRKYKEPKTKQKKKGKEVRNYIVQSGLNNGGNHDKENFRRNKIREDHFFV